MDVSWLLEPQSLLFMFILLVTMIWMYRRLTGTAKILPPGPNGWPLLGVLPSFCSRQNPLDLMISWSDKYGDIMSFRMGTMTLVVINEPKLIKEAFQIPELNHRARSLISEECIGICNNGIIRSFGQTWKEHRQFAHNVFRSLGVGKRSYEDTVAAEISQLMPAIEDERGFAFDPNNLLGNAIFNIICSITLGTQYKYSDPEFKTIHHIIDTNLALSGAGGALFFVPIPGISKIPFGRFRQMADNMRAMAILFWEKIESHKRNFDPSDPRDFIDLYLKKLSEVKDENTTFEEINLMACIADLVFAGTETTTSALKWAVMYIMANPGIQTRAQEELDRAVGRNRLPKLADRPNLPYTEAMLLECLRLADVAPLGVPHVAGEETMFHGYTIPKGSFVVSNLHKVLHDPKLWKDPMKFNPERYLNEDGTLFKRDELIVFSAGRRSCLGEQLARMEFFMFFTSLLHRFTFNKPDNSPPLSFDGVIGITRSPRPFETCAVKRDS